MTYQQLIESAESAEASAAHNARISDLNAEVAEEARALSLGFKRLAEHCRRAALDLPAGDAGPLSCCGAPDMEADGLC